MATASDPISIRPRSDSGLSGGDALSRVTDVGGWRAVTVTAPNDLADTASVDHDDRGRRRLAVRGVDGDHGDGAGLVQVEFDLRRSCADHDGLE
jgi:hypothetical protein